MVLKKAFWVNRIILLSCLVAVLFLLLPAVASADSSTISLGSRFDNATVDFKSTVRLYGRINPDHPNTSVIVESRRRGSSSFRTLGRTTTNSDGRFVYEFHTQASGSYRVKWYGDGGHDPATSEKIITIFVRVKIVLGKFSKPQYVGQDFYVTGKLYPTHVSRSVSVRVIRGGRWVTVAKGKTNSKSVFKVKVKIGRIGIKRFRVVYGDIDHALGSSEGFNVKIKWANPWNISAKYPHYIVVSKKSFYLWYLRNGRIVKKFRAGVGMPAYPTPSGNFRIVRKAVRPTWYRPGSAWARNMPASISWPYSPLGERGLYLSISGIIIHGTTQPWLLDRPYRAVSHGCIRQKNAWVIWLYNRVPVGTPVKIYG